MATVLVVEDEEHLRVTLEYNLRRAGYAVATADSGPTALERFAASAPDLVLLDVMLPGIDGFAVCRQIRQRSAVPILMLTARADEIDAVLGLELGADDYIAKPFRVRELLARIAAALRRPSLGSGNDTPPAPLVSGDLALNPVAHTLTRAGRPVILKPRAFALLQFFMQHPNRVFTRAELLQQLWGTPFIGDERTVDTHVRWIREQIEDDPSEPRRLCTVRMIGYQFVG
jgi:DNA-binding response OmpR family regulator